MPEGIKHRPLTDRLGLPPDALYWGGNMYPEEQVLVALTDLVVERRPVHVVALNSGLAVAVLARALTGFGGLTVIDHDPQEIEITRRMLDGIGEHAPVDIIEAELQDYDKHTLWYDRHLIALLPERIDLLFIDGPPHFCGKWPRYPAGPELFGRIGLDGMIVLEKAGRAKERKALQRWSKEFPALTQTRLKRGGGAMTLSLSATTGG
ncbi:MAG: hypothetical protein AAF334_07620 [Pseudomonadota bacterium]